jgi:D-sedoheptulose 7-phosphate isomerase
VTEYIDLVADGYRRRQQTVQAFFAAESARLAALCHSMARRFARGGRLIAFGVGPAATDAQHVSVGFVHPVIVGKRALPALALPNDVPTALGVASQNADDVFARSLRHLGGPEDIALGMIHGADDPGVPPVAAALKQATALGMLTIGLGTSDAAPGDADLVFGVPSDDPFLVQEVHETLYHVLWELVHVFFEHRGLLEDRPRGAAHDTGQSSWLYPFLAEAETDLDSVLRVVGASIEKKADDVTEMRLASTDPAGIVETARQIAGRVAMGGKVLTFGNGGSATDAQDLVVDLLLPPGGLEPIPAMSLTNDAAVVTAVGNDVGFDNVFARQLIAYGKPNDVAVAISTSGGSRNILAGLEEARRRGLLTVGLAGYGGGRMAGLCDRIHPVDGDYIPRIQEAQASQYHLLRLVLGRMHVGD